MVTSVVDLQRLTVRVCIGLQHLGKQRDCGDMQRPLFIPMLRYAVVRTPTGAMRKASGVKDNQHHHHDVGTANAKNFELQSATAKAPRKRLPPLLSPNYS